MTNYPCHCGEHEASCSCIPGRTVASAQIKNDLRGSTGDLRVDGQHLKHKPASPVSPRKLLIGKGKKSDFLFKDRLRIAAEYWHKRENFQTHWAGQWDTDRVAQFLHYITGVYPESLQINGKQLLRVSIYTHLQIVNHDHEAAAEEFLTVVPSAIHRKKVIRLLMQTKAPILIKDSSKQSLGYVPSQESITTVAPTQSSTVLSNIMDEDQRIAILKAQTNRPIVHVSCLKRVSSNQPQHLDIKIATASFALENSFAHEQELNVATSSKTQNNVNCRQPQVLTGKKDTALLPGVELTIVPRFQHAGIQFNPAKQTIKWLREQHEIAFEVEWRGGRERILYGHVEVWAGPVIIARGPIQLENGDAFRADNTPTKEADPSRLLSIDFTFFQRVNLVYLASDQYLNSALSRVEVNLRRFITLNHVLKEEGNIRSAWGSSKERGVQLIQIFLSHEAQSSKPFIKTVETITQLIENAKQLCEARPEVIVHSWSHPRPDRDLGPALAQLQSLIGSKTFVFHGFAMNQSSDATPYFTPSRPGKLFNLAPGTPIKYESSGEWLRGHIILTSEKSGTFTIAPSDGGKPIHGIPEHSIRVLGPESRFGDQETSQDTQHGNYRISNSKSSGTKRSRRRRDIFASLEVGENVFARIFPSKEYLAGVVVALHSASLTVDVAFNNGRAASQLDVRYVRQRPQRVQAQMQFHGGSKHGNNIDGAGHIDLQNRERTGGLAYGTLVQVLQTASAPGVCVTGRIKQSREYGLKYDVMLSNGELVENIPVRLLQVLDDSFHDVASPSNNASKHQQQGESSGSHNSPEHTYVDAMCDRFRQVIRDAAQARSDGRELRVQFNRLDTNGNGQLEAADFLSSLHDLGFRPTESEILEFVDRMSSHKDGFVSYVDFVRFALPDGISQGERQLKRSMAYYQASLEANGVLAELERALKSRIGELWEHLVESDVTALGILKEDTFTRCLQRLQIQLTSDQRVALVRAFTEAEDQIDYREFAIVVELLLTEKFVNTSVQIVSRTQKGRRAGELDEKLDADGQPFSLKEQRLRKEINSITRIQALARRRMAQRSVAILKRQIVRDSRTIEIWTGTSALSTSTKVDPKSSNLGANAQQVIDEWRKLLHLNTRHGGEVVSVFRAMDTNCDGVLTLEELSNALRRYSVDTRRTNMIFREMDLDNDGAIDLTDFKMFLQGSRKKISGESEENPADAHSVMHNMIEELGIDLCAKVRRYYSVLKRCGTDLLELLLYRPRGVTMSSVLRKQGFVLDTAEWKRLEVHFAGMADRRGDRLVCETFVKMMSLTQDEFDEQQFNKHEYHLRDYLQKSKIDSDGITGLGRLCHRVIAGIKELCKDPKRSKFKHEILWWLLAIHEPEISLEMDRLDLEQFLRTIKLRPTSYELDQIFQALDESESETVSCRELARLFGISRRINEYLETDYLYSRFCRSYVMTHRLRLGFQSFEVSRAARRGGSASAVHWLRDTIGVGAYRKLRAMLVASVARGLRFISGTWLSERMCAKLGFCSSAHFERALLELGLGLSQDEMHNLCKALCSSKGELDVFEFADLCEVVFTTPSASSGSTAGDGLSEDIEAEKARTETERYLREILQEYIRTPTGHRNILQVFESFDTQKNGTLDQSELEAVFQNLGVDLSKVDIGALLRHYDVNGDAQLSYMEFLEAIDIRVHAVIEQDAASSLESKLPKVKVDIDLSLVQDKLSGYALRTKLCREDVDDACGRIRAIGLLSRRDVVDILAALGLAQCLSDSELYIFSRYTKRRFKAFLMNVIKARALRQPRNAVKGGRGGVASNAMRFAGAARGQFGDKGGALAPDTAVIFKNATSTTSDGIVVGPGRNKDTFDVRLQNGKLVENVKRSQFVVSGGRPAICENAMVVDKASGKKGIVVRFTPADPSHVDVRIKNKIYKNVPISSLEVLPSDETVASLKQGIRVYAYSRVDKLYYAGTILRTDSRDGVVDVEFDHGELELTLLPKDVRSIRKTANNNK